MEIDSINELPGHGIASDDDPIVRAYDAQTKRGIPMPPAEVTHAWIKELKQKRGLA